MAQEAAGVTLPSSPEVTSLLVMTGDGNVEEQAGSYSDWEARGGRLIAKIDSSAAPTAMRSATTATSHAATAAEASTNDASQDAKPDDHSGNPPAKKKTKWGTLP